MGLTGIWRADPQPTQSRPTLPIALQGQQPPRTAMKVATMLAAVCMVWPGEGEPRLQQPKQTVRSVVAPLTLPYGQQPPIAGPLTPVETALARVAWPNEFEPRPLQPAQVRLPNAPIGTQARPPLPLGTPAVLASIIGQWPPAWTVVESGAEVAPIAIVTLPAAQPYTSVASAPVLCWPAPWTPASAASAVAAILPVLAVPGLPCSVPSGVLQAWQLAPFFEQSEPPVAPLTAVVVGTPPVPPNQAAIALWSAGWPLTATVPPGVAIAPLTLTYGQPPMPSGALAPLKLAVLSAQWPPLWTPASSTAPVAAWGGSVVVVAQPCPVSQAGISAWPAPWYPSQELIEIAPLTLPTGQQPAAKGPLTSAQLAQLVVGQWPAFWSPAQVAGPTAGWNVAPITPVVIGASNLSALVAQWPPCWWPAASAAPTASWNVPPVPIALPAERHRAVLRPWLDQAQWQIVPMPGLVVDTAAWNVPVVSPYTAPARFPWDALWQRLLAERPWTASQITQPGGSWIVSVPVVVVVLVHGKYAPEHADALHELAAIVAGTFAREHTDAQRELAAIADGAFAREHASALRDLLEDGV